MLTLGLEGWGVGFGRGRGREPGRGMEGSGLSGLRVSRGVLPHTDARVPPQGLWSGDANCSLGIESFNRGSDM